MVIIKQSFLCPVHPERDNLAGLVNDAIEVVQAPALVSELSRYRLNVLACLRQQRLGSLTRC